MSRLTISVVSHGHGSLLNRLLGDLDTCASFADARVLVTLNLPNEPFDATVFKRLDVTVIRNEIPKGFGANHNAAFARCATEWFAVLNPDLYTLPSDDPLAELVKHAATDEDVALAVPVVINSLGRVEDSVRANLSLPSVIGRRFHRSDSAEPRGGTFHWYAGMCMLFRSSAFRAIGGFDERYFLYCEDYDICARLYLAGYRLKQVPSSRVIHDAQRDSHRSSRHLRLHLTSLIRVWTSRPFWQIVFNHHPASRPT